MNSIFLLSLLLYVLYPIVTAQGPVASDISPSTTAATTISTISLTPEMSASAVSSLYQTLATSVPSQPGDGKQDSMK